MRDISQERLLKDVHRVLENPFWISELSLDETYSRLHDDHDGTFSGTINVTFGPDGDAYVFVENKRRYQWLRFRNYCGGGTSLRTRNALMILALAIKLDEKERPQKKGEQDE